MDELTIEKKEQLAEFLNIDAAEIEVDENSGEFYTPEGTYTVMDEDEAERAHKEYIESFIDEVGIGGFTEGFRGEIYRDCIDNEQLGDIIYEDKQNYVGDLETDELLAMAEDMALLSKEQYNEIHNDVTSDARKEDIANDVRDAVVDRLYDYVLEDYNDRLGEYIVDDLGDGELALMIRNNPSLLDVDEIVSRCAEADGYGHSLASWDGETNEIGEFYAFKQSNTDDRSPTFIQSLDKNTRAVEVDR